MMRVFKHVERAVCYTCDARWFGRDGDVQAQLHADQTGHNVVTEVLTRTTYNGDVLGEAVPPPTVLPLVEPALPVATEREPVVEDPWPAPTGKIAGRVRYAGADKLEGDQLARLWGQL